jgi:hypothetical protein
VGRTGDLIMGLFLDVPSLDDRVLDERGIAYLKSIYDLEQVLIVPTISRLHVKNTGERLGRKHTKVDGYVWNQAIMLENAGYLYIDHSGRGSAVCKLTKKGRDFLGLSEYSFENI